MLHYGRVLEYRAACPKHSLFVSDCPLTTYVFAPTDAWTVPRWGKWEKSRRGARTERNRQKQSTRQTRARRSRSALKLLEFPHRGSVPTTRHNRQIGRSGCAHSRNKQLPVGRIHRLLLTLGLDEVDHLAVVLEHVHLLDGRDVGHTDPLEGRRELLVVCSKKIPFGTSESVATERLAYTKISRSPRIPSEHGSNKPMGPKS